MSTIISNNDIEIVGNIAPRQMVTVIKFSPHEDYVAIGSYDRMIYIFEIRSDPLSAILKTQYPHDGFPMDLTWSPNGQLVVSVDSKKNIKVYDIMQNNHFDIPNAHNDIIKCVRYASLNENVIVTGSFDKTIKYWNLDTRQSTGIVALKDEVFSLDVAFPLMVVGMANRHIAIFDLFKPMTPYRETFSTLKYQTRTVLAFNKPYYGYMVGTLEGRVGVTTAEPHNLDKRFTFKCINRMNKPNTGTSAQSNIKQMNKLGSANSIALYKANPNRIATGGSDSIIAFWDFVEKNSKGKVIGLPNSVLAMDFNLKGNLLVYGVGEDFTDMDKIRNFQGNERFGVFLHKVTSSDQLN